MTLDAERLIDEACTATGLDAFGGDSFREGLGRLCDALATEAGLSALGETILGMRLAGLLTNRLRIEATYRDHPEIDDEVVAAPLFIIGLPRTGTTALSNLVATAPPVRSLRLWESSDPVPPPDASVADDGRIAAATAGLQAMYETFPRMKSLYFQTPEGPTECQDLLGMEMRTAHFDGMARVPSYTDWVVDCDMAPAYRYHRRVLRLLQWKTPAPVWHLKTPVHMLALDDLLAVYPDARFLWTHRHPAEVLGSVCSLVAYTRSWVSDGGDPLELGLQQLRVWELAIARAMAFRDRLGEARFADVPFDALNTRPVPTVHDALARVGVELGAEELAPVQRWAEAHPPGAHGTHEFALSEFGLEPAQVTARFAAYLDRFDVPQRDR